MKREFGTSVNTKFTNNTITSACVLTGKGAGNSFLAAVNDSIGYYQKYPIISSTINETVYKIGYDFARNEPFPTND